MPEDYTHKLVLIPHTERGRGLKSYKTMTDVRISRLLRIVTSFKF
jgi:hypothetical protein